MVTLSVAIIGVPGSTFSVTIDENERVFQLRDAIRPMHEITARADSFQLRLYLAKKKKDRKWMTRQQIVGLGGGRGLVPVGESMQRLRCVGLADADVNQVEDPDESEDRVHVLVMMPYKRFRLLPITVNEYQFADVLASYQAIAQRLKDTKEVQSLSKQLENIVAKGDESFVVLQSSNGMGKTQMAFNLQASDAWEVFYMTCCAPGDSGQPVSSAHGERSLTFHICIRNDLDAMTKARDMEQRTTNGLRKDTDGALSLFARDHSVADGKKETKTTNTARDAEVGSTDHLRDQPTLLVYGFILAALRGYGAFTDSAQRGDVEKELQLRRKRGAKPMLFFLDEFPSIAKPDESSDTPTYHRHWLRLMRDVFRSFKLPLVVSSSHPTGRTLIPIGRRLDGMAPSSLWCVVMPSLPRMVITEEESTLMPALVKNIISHSRPLFSNKAIEYVRTHAHDGDEGGIVTYLDAMVSVLAKTWWWVADERAVGGAAGQLGLLLYCTSDSPVPVRYNASVIKGHFARLVETTAFELTLTGDGVFFKDGKRWALCCVLPSPEEDLLLHLMLTGGPWLRPFSKRLYRAMPPLISRYDAAFLQSLTSAAVVVASHTGGFGGVAFPLFLRELLMEMGLTDPDEVSDKLELPEKIAGWASVVVPFLSPANAPWPAWLQDSSTRFDSLTQQDNDAEKRVEFRTASNAISVDCVKVEKTPLDPQAMQSILKAMPVDCTTHVVVVHSLQKKYFTARKSWAAFVAEHPQLEHVGFYRVGKGARLREVAGMHYHGSAAKKLVLFVESE